MIRSLKRLALFTLLFLALSALGTWVVYDQVAGESVTFDGALLSPTILAACAALLLLYFAADGLRLFFTLRALGVRLRFRWILRLVFINIFVSNVTPLATGGGVAQVLYLKARDVPLGTATAATTIRTVLAVLFIFSSAPVFLLTLSPLTGGRPGERIGLYLVLAVAAYLAFFIVVLLRTRWLVPPLVGIVRLLRGTHLIGDRRARRWRFRVRRELIRFSRSFRRYLLGPRWDVVLSVVSTLVFLLTLFSFPAVLLWGLGYDIPYGTVLGLLVLTTFVMYFSPTPGASGVAEGAFGFLFAGLISHEHLVQVTVVWRFLTVYLGMAVGVFVTQHELMGAGAADV